MVFEAPGRVRPSPPPHCGIRRLKRWYSHFIPWRLDRRGGSAPLALQVTVERLWSNNKVRSVFSNLLLVGGVIYMARGSYGPGFLTSADVKTAF